MLGFLVYLAVAALGFLLPAPAGVTEAGWRVLFVFIATILAFITRPLAMGPMVLVSLVLVGTTHTLELDRKLRQLLDEGYAGEIHAVEVLATQQGRFADLGDALHWRQNIALSGNNILNMGIWYEAMMRWLGPARRVMAIWRDALGASGGPFLFGTFTNADAMFAPVATRFVTYGVDLDAQCRAYVDAVYAHPGMKQWIADAGQEPKSR